MLFPTRLHEAIRRGEVRVAYRTWDHARARAGARHRFGADGVLEIVAVDRVRAGAITARDARAAGYSDAAALLADLRRHAEVAPDTPLFRVRFRYVAEEDARRVMARDSELSAADCAAIDARLARMDASRVSGPWTRATLALIAAHPRRRAGDLADLLGRERLDFKKDVRRLKALGLTISHEVGYELSPRGRAYVDGDSAAMRKARPRGSRP